MTTFVLCAVSFWIGVAAGVAGSIYAARKNITFRG